MSDVVAAASFVVDLLKIVLRKISSLLSQALTDAIEILTQRRDFSFSVGGRREEGSRKCPSKNGMISPSQMKKRKGIYRTIFFIASPW